MVIFHDDSTFQAIEQDSWVMGSESEHIQPNYLRSEIMVSDFIDEHNGYLSLTQKEY